RKQSTGRPQTQRLVKLKVNKATTNRHKGPSHITGCLPQGASGARYAESAQSSRPRATSSLHLHFPPPSLLPKDTPAPLFVAMNTEGAQSARLEHLHTASRMAFGICPQLAAYYGNELLVGLGDQRVSDAISRHTCLYCGSALVDGRSVSRVSIVRAAARSNIAPKVAPVKNSDKKRQGRVTKTAGKKQKSKPSSNAQAGRRLVRVRLNAVLPTGKTVMSREDHLAALKDQRNTVEYACGLCDSRIVYPGATNTQLRLAGLDVPDPSTRNPKHESAAAAALHKQDNVPEIKDSTNKQKDHKARHSSMAHSATPARQQTAAPMDHRNKAIHSRSAATGAAASPTNNPSTRAQTPDGAANPSTKKKKSKKSNLLAMVAANNKKKTEEKNKKEGSLSLSSFLSSL
ncbi:hypothetical protein GQ54DRAFT_77963, partial [Martensiomyces pterosporus]